MKTLDILTPADKEAVDLPRLLADEPAAAGRKKLYIESYGCQMNFSDSEIVASILKEGGFATTSSADEADGRPSSSARPYSSIAVGLVTWALFSSSSIGAVIATLT